MEQRLNRILSLAGVASRRKADEFIQSGRVMVNGRRVFELGTKALWGTDSIKLDGKEIPAPSDRVYIMLNKPFGYITSLADPEGRPIVTDIIKDIPQRLYPVGRLDFDSIGLLLMTNDGDFSYRLTHPKYHVPKTYKVTVEGSVREDTVKKLKDGVELDDGFSGKSKASLIKQTGSRSVIRITVSQGRNRLVRRMVEAAGCNVIQLMRTGFGSLEIGNLKIGKYRFLTPEEISGLKRSVGLSS
ncbi:MAG: rRNA pseudouridine synthase [Deltaproteobacteria bacterium]|nr:rRNA pseudouridine synthase [Deltaproteobacteria bacterium]